MRKIFTSKGFNEKLPILQQFPEYKSAAILFHPFVKMPNGWEVPIENKHINRMFPSDNEALLYGQELSWRVVMEMSGLSSPYEIEVALQTYIGALGKKNMNQDMANRLDNKMVDGLYMPNEDEPTIFLLEKMLNVLRLTGAKSITCKDLIETGDTFLAETVKATDISSFPFGSIERHLYDDQKQFYFYSLVDSFFTIMFSKEKEIKPIVAAANMEGIICTKETTALWQFEHKKETFLWMNVGPIN